MEIYELLSICHERQASDLHLMKHEPPVLRIDGALHRTELPPFSEEQLDELLLGMLNEAQREEFLRNADINFASDYAGLPRFRINIHRQRGAIEAAFHRLPTTIPTFAELGLPEIVSELAAKPNGLVLITGAAGMGKSTTLASMVDYLNSQRESLIILLEDPIEYVHTNKKSFIKQREISYDSPSFALALKNALRQDPNIIAIGELRDLDTIATALTAAETGHLVLATLHTTDAAHTIQRIINVFPASQQAQVRTQLAASLQGIISQLLLPDTSGVGLVLATEILIATPAVRNVIRKPAIEQIPTIIQTGATFGMQSMETSLSQLVKANRIPCEIALTNSRYIDAFVCPAAEKLR